MSLPAIRISSVTEPRDREVSVVGLPQSVAAGTETILLVEDDQMVRTLARHILQIIGYDVLEAESGSEAMSICEGHQGTVHLLLTDVVMPQMSGPLLSEKVIRRFPDIGVLYMSGYNDDTIMHHGALGEGVPFLQKPFSPEILAGKVREVLDATGQALSYASRILRQHP